MAVAQSPYLALGASAGSAPGEITQVQEIVTNGTAAEFADIRHGSLEMIRLDSAPDALHKPPVKPCGGGFVVAIALVYQQRERLSDR